MKCMEVWGGHGATNHHVTRPGLDVWIWSQSREVSDAGGGDLHLLSSCASGRITRLVFADVCGFGSLFADIAADLRELMKRNVNSLAQARFVRQMSCRLDEAAERGGFASTLVSTYFAPTRSLTLCNAGHPPPLLWRGETGAWSIFRHTSCDTAACEPKPGVIDPSEYQQFKTRLEIGDLVLIYSNALTECRDTEGRTMGLDGVLDRVRSLDEHTPSQMPARLIELLRGEHAGNLATDDATLILCQATQTAVTWRDNILAPFRLLRSVSDTTQIG